MPNIANAATAARAGARQPELRAACTCRGVNLSRARRRWAVAARTPLDIDANTLVILKLPGEIDLPIRTACRRYATTVHSASFEYELQPDPFSVARDALAR